MKLSSESLLNLLNYAEIQYKYALALNSYYSTHRRFPKLMYYDVFSWGKNILYKKDLALSETNEKNAVMFLSHSALYLLATQIDSILEALYGKARFQDKNVGDISCVVRLIRNAFAHNPFQPTWIIDRKYMNKNYEIDLKIKLSTAQLRNKSVKRRDYGGPIAILKIAAFVRQLILDNIANIRMEGDNVSSST